MSCKIGNVGSPLLGWVSTFIHSSANDCEISYLSLAEIKVLGVFWQTSDFGKDQIFLYMFFILLLYHYIV